MSHEPNDSSSDLDRARALSKRLQGPAATRPDVRKDEPAFARFTPQRVRPAASAPAPEPKESVPPSSRPFPVPLKKLNPPPARTGRSSDWAQLLAWCLEALGARSAHLIDRSGLLVASAGPVSPERAESMGSRLVIALEQGAEIGGADANMLEFSFPGGHVTGARLDVGGGNWIVLALETPAPLEGIERTSLRLAVSETPAL